MVMYCPQPPVVPRDDVMLSLTTNLVQAVLQLKNRFKGATAEDYMEFVKVIKLNTVLLRSVTEHGCRGHVSIYVITRLQCRGHVSIYVITRL